MMIHYQIDSSEGLVKIGWLDVNQSQPCTVLMQIFVIDSVDLDIQQTDHREVLRPCDLAEGDNRSRHPISSQESLQRQRAADGVGVRIMLKQDVDLLPFAEKRADPIHCLSIHHIQKLRHTEFFKNIFELKLLNQRIFGFLSFFTICRKGKD